MTSGKKENRVISGRRWLMLVLLVAALVLAGLGQFYFFHRREYLWDGVAFHALAVTAFLPVIMGTTYSSPGFTKYVYPAEKSLRSLNPRTTVMSPVEIPSGVTVRIS